MCSTEKAKLRETYLGSYYNQEELIAKYPGNKTPAVSASSRKLGESSSTSSFTTATDIRVEPVDRWIIDIKLLQNYLLDVAMCRSCGVGDLVVDEET